MKQTTNLFLFFILFIMSIVFLMLPVSAFDNYATSGTVTYQLQDSLGYNIAEDNYANQITPTVIRHRFTDAKILNSLTNIGAYTFTSDGYSNSTTFTATVDSVYYGSGIASISSVSGVVYSIDFNVVDKVYADTLTGDKTIDLVFDQSIFNGVTAVVRYDTIALTSANPTYFDAAGAGTAAIGAYVSSISSYYVHDYVYDYDSSLDFFTLDVDKNDYSSMLYIVNKSGDIYTSDTAYSTTDLSMYKPYNNGVVLSMKVDVDGGTYVNTTIHIGVEDQTGSITLDKTSYSQSETMTMTYSIHDFDTITYDYYLDVTTGDSTDRFYLFVPNADYTYGFDLNSPLGIYYVDLVYELISDNSVSGILASDFASLSEYGDTAITISSAYDNVTAYNLPKNTHVKFDVISNINIDNVYSSLVTTNVGHTYFINEEIEQGMDGNTAYIVINFSEVGEREVMLQVCNESTSTCANYVFTGYEIGIASEVMHIKYIRNNFTDSSDITLHITQGTSVRFSIWCDKNIDVLTGDSISCFNDTVAGHGYMDILFDTAGSYAAMLTAYNASVDNSDSQVWSVYVLPINATGGTHGSVYWTVNPCIVGDTTFIHYNAVNVTNPMLKVVSECGTFETTYGLFSESGTTVFIPEIVGTYNVTLFEKLNPTVVYASDVLTVWYSETDVTDPTEPDISDFSGKFETMLSNDAFIALLVIIACVGAFGKIGGVVGVFLGMVTGISISFLMGYLPIWILFVMVLALCVVFVSKLINSFGGNE